MVDFVVEVSESLYRKLMGNGGLMGVGPLWIWPADG